MFCGRAPVHTRGGCRAPQHPRKQTRSRGERPQARRALLDLGGQHGLAFLNVFALASELTHLERDFASGGDESLLRPLRGAFLAVTPSSKVSKMFTRLGQIGTHALVVTNDGVQTGSRRILVRSFLAGHE